MQADVVDLVVREVRVLPLEAVDGLGDVGLLLTTTGVVLDLLDGAGGHLLGAGDGGPHLLELTVELDGDLVVGVDPLGEVGGLVDRRGILHGRSRGRRTGPLGLEIAVHLAGELGVLDQHPAEMEEGVGL